MIEVLGQFPLVTEISGHCHLGAGIPVASALVDAYS